MPWTHLLARRLLNFPSIYSQTRNFHGSAVRAIPLHQTPRLTSWDLHQFTHKAFQPALPTHLPFSLGHLPPACSKWFVHDSNPAYELNREACPKHSELRTSFWSEHKDILVPLELTTRTTSGSSTQVSEPPTFSRANAPLKLLLTYLGNARSPNDTPLQHEHSIYLAQCSMNRLPSPLQADLPTPELVLHAGKGDLYDSSLWLGRPPTYTPLHRDPNPNLFLQLAGKKAVRLFPPEVGDHIFSTVQEQLQSHFGASQTPSSAAIRGEEMMAGPERELLHDLVWQPDRSGIRDVLHTYGQEANLNLGEALFIPKGWWHSVKGIGEGVTASANWWFR